MPGGGGMSKGWQQGIAGSVRGKIMSLITWRLKIHFKTPRDTIHMMHISLVPY